MIRKLLLLLLTLSVCDAATPTENAGSALVQRVVKSHAEGFRVQEIPPADGKDVFEIEDAGDGKIVLRGNNGVSIASALGHYLKTRAQCHLSFCGDQLDLPTTLPKVGTKERIVNTFQHRVFFNWCTLSYTGSWWDWNDWQRVLDFLALNGINRPLDITGLECVWYDTLLQHGFNDEEARKFLVGPAFFAWQWMTNIQSHCGPLPKSWLDQRRVLSKQIIERERELGMEPIFQGFSGYVPRELKQKFPDAAVAMQPSWCSFPGSAQLDPLDPLFEKIGTTWYEELGKFYGSLHYIAADPFHESSPPKPGDEYLENVGKAIFAQMKKATKDPIWVMQSWSIRKPIATSLPAENLLVLDLNGERWKSTEKFWGRPFVSGMLHNFGGRINLHGDLKGLAANPFHKTQQLAPNATGMGLFMEAIVQNPVIYDLALDSIWREEPVDPEAWLKGYARRRYGAESPAAVEAWKILLAGPYRPGTMGTENSSMPAARPAINPKKSGPNSGFSIPYDSAELMRAWGLLLKDAPQLSKSDAWRFDVVDVGRQVMSNLAQPVQRDLANAFAEKDSARFEARVKTFDGILADMDRLLATRDEYSLGKWIADARRFGKTDAERDLYERNAVMLVTWWGPEKDAPGNVPNIFDYSWREWSGLVGGYYRMRWTDFHQHIAGILKNKGEWDESKLAQAHGRPALRSNEYFSSLANKEWAWITSAHKLPVKASGDPAPIAQELFSKYGALVPEMAKSNAAAQAAAAGLPKSAKVVGTWKSGQYKTQWEKISIDLTKHLESGGSWTLGAIYQNGGSRLHVRNVTLRFNSEAVAKDLHEGTTGDKHENNSWTLQVPEIPLNTPMILEAEVRTDGTTNSNGIYYLKSGN